MSLQNLYNELDSGQWCHPDPFICECQGKGQILSDLDIRFKCRYHYFSGCMPDDDGDRECHLNKEELDNLEKDYKQGKENNWFKAIDYYAEVLENKKQEYLEKISSIDDVKEKVKILREACAEIERQRMYDYIYRDDLTEYEGPEHDDY
jgi:hypothetical protein